MYHSFLIHLSADGHLGCFYVLAMINSAAMNIGVHVSLSDLVSLVCMPRSGIAGSSISLHWSLRKAFLSLLAILWNSAYKWVYLSFSPLPLASLLFSAICKASPDNHFAFLNFFFLGMVLITDSCTMSRASVQSSSGTLSDLISWIYLSLPLPNHKGFDSGHTWIWSSGFPCFLQFKSEFFNKEFMIWALVSSCSCFCWLYRASPSSAAKNIFNLILVLTELGY